MVIKQFLNLLLRVFELLISLSYKITHIFDKPDFDTRFLNNEERNEFEKIVYELKETRNKKPTKVKIGGKETKIVVLS